MLPLIPLVGAGMGLLQTGLGIGKTAKANKLRKQAQSFFEKNQYEIPESAKASLGLAQRQANTSLPYEDLTRAKIGESTARGVSASKSVGTSASDILAQMASLYGNEQRQDVNLGIEGAQRYDRNQRNVLHALDNMANYETQKWQYNVLYPYQQMMGQAGQLSDQGNQMISGGVGQIGMAGASFMQNQMLDKQLGAMERSVLGGGGYSNLSAPYAMSSKSLTAPNEQYIRPNSMLNF